MIRYLQTTVLPYVHSTLLPSKPAQLVIQTWLKWDRDNAPGMAAALSYYALFSLFPLLLVLGTALLMLMSLVSNIVVKTVTELVTHFRETFSFIQIDELQLT